MWRFGSRHWVFTQNFDSGLKAVGCYAFYERPLIDCATLANVSQKLLKTWLGRNAYSSICAQKIQPPAPVTLEAERLLRYFRVYSDICRAFVKTEAQTCVWI